MAYLPLMLDLSSHIEGGLALLRGLSRRLSLLCGLLEDGGRDIETEAFASIHTEDIPVVFALFNTFVRGIIAHLEWVLSKIGELPILGLRNQTLHRQLRQQRSTYYDSEIRLEFVNKV